MNIQKTSGLVNRDIDLLAPFVKLRMLDALKLCNYADNMPIVTLFEGFRSPFRQETLYNQGRTEPGKIVTDAKPWRSWHQYGLAIDLAFMDPHGHWSWAGDFGAVAKNFKVLGFEWLYPKESVHFQITGGVDIEDAYRITSQFGLQSLWSVIKERIGNR